MTINGTNQNFSIRGTSSRASHVRIFDDEHGRQRRERHQRQRTGIRESASLSTSCVGSAAITCGSIMPGIGRRTCTCSMPTVRRSTGLTVDGSTFGLNNTTTATTTSLIESQNAGTTLNFTLQNSTIKGARADWINASNNSSSTMDVDNSEQHLRQPGCEHNAGSAAGGNRVVLGASAR